MRLWSKDGLHMCCFQRRVFDSQVAGKVLDSNELKKGKSLNRECWSADSEESESDSGSELESSDDEAQSDIEETNSTENVGGKTASDAGDLTNHVQAVHKAQIMKFRQRIAEKIMEVHLKVSNMIPNGGDPNRTDNKVLDLKARKKYRGRTKKEQTKSRNKKKRAKNHDMESMPSASGTLLIRNLQALLDCNDDKVEQLCEGTLFIVDKALESIIEGNLDEKRSTRLLLHLWNSSESNHSYKMTYLGKGNIKYYDHYHHVYDDQENGKSDQISTSKNKKSKHDKDSPSFHLLHNERQFVIRSLRAAIAHKRLVHGHTIRDVQSLFDLADKNGDGVLDCNEITDVLKDLDIPFSTSHAKYDFAHVLTHGGTHGVPVKEFMDVICSHHHDRTAELIERYENGEDVLTLMCEDMKMHLLDEK